MGPAQQIAAFPLPLRWVITGALGLGLLGCAAGLGIGLRVHAATAWAATFEVGLPAALLGGVLGWLAGSWRLRVGRRGPSRPTGGP